MTDEKVKKLWWIGSLILILFTPILLVKVTLISLSTYRLIAFVNRPKRVPIRVRSRYRK